ncbi:unnamed protein product, partial [Ixodes hexagonus]
TGGPAYFAREPNSPPKSTRTAAEKAPSAPTRRNQGRFSTPKRAKPSHMAGVTRHRKHCACAGHAPLQEKAARTALTAQIQGEKNIAVVSTAREDIAYKLLTGQSLTLGGKAYPTHTYVAAPDGSTKAVVHGVKPNIPQAELMEDLDAKG